MTDPSRDDDEIDRMTINERIERDRQIIATYEENMAFYRRRIEDDRYRLGRLDERLGG